MRLNETHIPLLNRIIKFRMNDNIKAVIKLDHLDLLSEVWIKLASMEFVDEKHLFYSAHQAFSQLMASINKKYQRDGSYKAFEIKEKDSEDDMPIPGLITPEDEYKEDTKVQRAINTLPDVHATIIKCEYGYIELVNSIGHNEKASHNDIAEYLFTIGLTPRVYSREMIRVKLEQAKEMLKKLLK